jgi:hypothetical protein
MALGGLPTIDWSIFAVGDDDEEQLRKLDVEQYFTRKELDGMCEYELMRYRKIVQNHATMHKLGLTLTKPWFVERFEKRLKNPKATEPSRPSIDYDAPHDKDWTPQSERRQGESVYKGIPTRKPRTRHRKSTAQITTTKAQADIDQVITSNIVCLNSLMYKYIVDLFVLQLFSIKCIYANYRKYLRVNIIKSIFLSSSIIQLLMCTVYV